MVLHCCGAQPGGHDLHGRAIDRRCASAPALAAAGDQGGGEVGQGDDPVSTGAGRGQPAAWCRAECVDQLKPGVPASRGRTDAGHHQVDVRPAGEDADDLLRLGSGVDQGDWAGHVQAAVQELVHGLVPGKAAVWPGGGQRRARPHGGHAAVDRGGQRPQSRVAVRAGRCRQALSPTGDLLPVHGRVAQSPHTGSPASTESGPAGGCAVADVAGTDRYRRRLDSRTGVEQGSVAGAHLVLAGDAHHHHGAGERGRCRCRSQVMNDPQREQDGPEHQQHDDPPAYGRPPRGPAGDRLPAR